MRVLTPAGARVGYRVRGSFKDRTDFFGDYAIRVSSIERDFDARKDSLVLVKLEDGANADAVGASIDRLLDRRFATVESLDEGELQESLSSQIDQLVGLLYAALAGRPRLAVRDRQHAGARDLRANARAQVLRAIGMSRRQVRRVVRYEAVITALIGALIGMVLGLFFAIVVSRPLADEGFVLSFPVVALIVFLVLTALAGVVAAILPARRASRLDVLEALAYE